MAYQQVADGPIFRVTRALSDHVREPRSQVEFEGQTWYLAAGVAAETRPVFVDGPTACGRCQSPEVRVVAFQSCVHPHSGDLYWDSEVVCLACGAHTAESYSEH